MIGKTHLATALGYAACLEGHSVLFSGAIEVINDLQAAQKQGGLKRALKKYLRPALLILDEVGYCPSTRKERTCSSKSSASVTNAAPSS